MKDAFHMRGEMNLNRYEVSFRLTVSFRCSVSSLLVCTWIEAKWNSNRYGFHIRHLDQNEISNWHAIFMWTKFTRSEMNKRKLVGYCFWWACAFETHCGYFDRNEICLRMSIKISGRFEIQLKWNVMSTEFFSHRFEISIGHEFISRLFCT